MRQRHPEAGGVAHVRAERKLLRTTLSGAEFAMGLVAGLVAAIGAETALAILQINVLISLGPDWRLWGCRFAARRCSVCGEAAFVC